MRTRRLPIGLLALSTLAALLQPASWADSSDNSCAGQLQIVGGTPTPISGMGRSGQWGPVLLASPPDQQFSHQGLTLLASTNGAITWTHAIPPPPVVIAGGRLTVGRGIAAAFDVSESCAEVDIEGRSLAGAALAHVVLHTLRPAGTKAPNVVSLAVGDPGTGVPAVDVETRVRNINPLADLPAGLLSNYDAGTYSAEGRDVTDDQPRSGTVAVVEPTTGRVVLRRDYTGLWGAGPVGTFSGGGSSARFVLMMGGTVTSATQTDVSTDLYGYRGRALAWHTKVDALRSAWMVRDAKYGPVFVTDDPSATTGTNIAGVTASLSRLTAVDRLTGRVRWTRDFANVLPTVYEQGGDLLVSIPSTATDPAPQIERISGTTGATLFSVSNVALTGVADLNGDGVLDGVTTDGYVDGRTGAHVTYPTLFEADYIVAVPSASGGSGSDLVVYRESDNGAAAGTLLDLITLVSGRTGQILWTVPTPHATQRAGSAYVEGTTLGLVQGHLDVVLFRPNTRTVTAYNGTTGALDWTTDVG